jgi:hypothetical protein
LTGAPKRFDARRSKAGDVEFEGVQEHVNTRHVEAEVHRRKPPRRQGSPDGWLRAARTVEHEKPTASRSSDLAPERTTAPRQSVALVDERVGDRRCKSFLALPGHVEYLANRVEVSVFQSVPRIRRETLDGIQRLDDITHGMDSTSVLVA